MSKHTKRKRRLKPQTAEKIAKIVIWSAAILVLIVLLSILGDILIKGLPRLNWSFLSEVPRDMGRAGGVLSPLVGTLLVTAVAITIAVPFSVGAAFYLAEYTKDNLVTRIIRFSIESLAAIPSIVYALFGFIFFVIQLNLGWSIISGGLTLAIMILPIIIRTSEEAILSVPQVYREASYCLGATKWQTIIKVVFPSAMRGITNGVILSIGACVAETAAIMLTAGSVLRMPESLLDPTRTLAVHFFILAREGISMENAYGAAALLIILIFTINVVANALVNKFARHSH